MNLTNRSFLSLVIFTYYGKFIMFLLLLCYGPVCYAQYSLSFSFNRIDEDTFRACDAVKVYLAPGVYRMDVNNLKNESGETIRLLFLTENSLDVKTKDHSSFNRIVDLSFFSDTLMYFVIDQQQASQINFMRVLAKTRKSFSGEIELKLAKADINELKKKKQKALIGAIFFDGWSYISNQPNNYDSNQLYKLSSKYIDSGRFNNENVVQSYVKDCPDNEVPFSGKGDRIEDWRDYVYATTGIFPPAGVSYSNYFPNDVFKQRGAIYTGESGQKKKLRSILLPSVEPIREYNGVVLGWRNTDTVEQMETQIDMASNFGIDYFVFNVKVTSDMINKGEIDPDLFYGTRYSTIGNHALVNFIKAKNRKKMKFCLMLNVYPGSTADYKIMIAYLRDNFFCQSNYLQKDEKPLFLHFHECNVACQQIIGRDVCQLGNGISNYIDGVFNYSGANWHIKKYQAFPDNGYYIYPSSNLVESSLSLGLAYKNYRNIMIPLNIGFDCSARANFDDPYFWRFQTLSSSELEDYFTAQILSYSSYPHEKFYLIYAWNEYCEGSWLMPTQQEYETGKEFDKLNVIKKIKKYYLR